MVDQNNDIKFSIVTVCYNSEQHIEQTIKSVINQSYKNIEYIIIDGGSTDGTLDIIKKYKPYIAYWVSEPDNGTYDAMNKGIRVATGDFISFLNSDDWYSEDSLQRVAVAYKESNGEILYGDLKIVNEHGDTIKLISRAETDFNNIFLKTVVDHPCAFVKASILKNRPFNVQYKIAADYDLFNELYLKKYKFKYVDNGYIANFRLGGYSTTAVLACRKETYKIGKKYLKYHKDKSWYASVKRKLRKNRLFIFLFELHERLGENYIKKIKGTFLKNNIDNVYVFGAGDVGMILGKILEKINIKFCFVDNNVNLQRDTILGRKVLPPSSMILSSNSIVLIANMGDTTDMIKQSCASGFEINVNLFDYYDWCGYLAYLKYNMPLGI